MGRNIVMGNIVFQNYAEQNVSVLKAAVRNIMKRDEKTEMCGAEMHEQKVALISADCEQENIWVKMGT